MSETMSLFPQDVEHPECHREPARLADTRALREPREIRFFVPGECETKGSKKGFVNPRNGRVVITDSNSGRLGRWQGKIAEMAEAAKERESFAPLSGRVVISLAFRVPRPKSHFLPANARRSAPMLRDDAPSACGTGKDGDKLERSVWDALTGVLFADDARIVIWHGFKRFAQPGEPVGVEITATEYLGQ